MVLGFGVLDLLLGSLFTIAYFLTRDSAGPDMSVYAVAQFTFTDRAKYDRYQARFMEVFRRSRAGCWRRRASGNHRR